jgi:antitoxin VapB
MSTATGKIFMTGRSQAVRLPKQFRLPGKEVRIRAVEGGLLLEPVVESLEAIWAAIDARGPVDLERNQPPMPADEEGDMFE